MPNDRDEFEKEMLDEDTAEAEAKLQDCGHPGAAIVSRGRGNKAVSFCSMCEADARAMSDIGNDCAMCGNLIVGSHYLCVNVGDKPVCLGCHSKMLAHQCRYQSDALPTVGLAYDYDQRNDILTIEGMKYAGDVFRSMGFVPVGAVFRVEGRKDGVITLKRIE